MSARAGDLPIDAGDLGAEALSALFDARDAVARGWGHDVEPAAAGLDLLVARLGEVRVGFPARSLAGVVSPVNAVPLPGASADLAGLFSHRGRIVSLVHLDRALDLPSAPAAGRSTALLLRTAGRPLAFAVDEALGVLHAVPEGDGSRYARLAGEEAVLIVDIEAVLERLGLAGSGEKGMDRR